MGEVGSTGSLMPPNARASRRQKTFTRKDVCTPMFIATLFTVARTWKQPKCPMIDDWLKKLWYIHTMEYYSAIRDEILPFATTWMDLEIITLSEISQTKKLKIT